VNVVRHANATEFLARAKLWLERAEAENNVILGVAGFFESYSGKTTPYFLTVENYGTVVGAALMTPPRRLLISSMPNSAARALADYMLADGTPVPGVLGPTDCAQVFAEKWRANTGMTARVKMSERLYACTAVTPPALSPGYLRTASTEDESLLVKWAGEFCREGRIEDEAAYTKSQIPILIAEKWLYVWENSAVVSMADLGRETAHGFAVSLVYTPPHLRNKGYATSCVAALTQRTLASGKRFCCLYTDLANPTSNSIYQKIGYQPICDVQDWVFE
jgi:predicted GNAT family acetyltransferase